MVVRSTAYVRPRRRPPPPAYPPSSTCPRPQISHFTIRHDDERLHPDKKKVMDKTGARPPKGLLTAQLFEQLAKIFAKSVDTSAAVRVVLTSQVTLLGGSATVAEAQDHFSFRLRDASKRSVRTHRESVTYSGQPLDFHVADVHEDGVDEAGGAEEE